MPRLWRYKRDDKEFGPVTPDDLKLLADSKRLLPTDLVCKDGTTKWISARSVRGLFQPLKPSAPRRLVAWMKRTGLVAPLLALLAVGIGVAFLIYALRNPAGAAPAPAAVAAAPAAVNPVPAAPVQPSPEKVDPDLSKHLLGALQDMREARSALRGGGHEFGDRFESVTNVLDEVIDQTEKAARTAGVDPTNVNADADVHWKHTDNANPHQALTEILEARLEIKDAKQDFSDRDRTLHELSRAADKLQTALQPVR